MNGRIGGQEADVLFRRKAGAHTDKRRRREAGRGNKRRAIRASQEEN